MSAPSVPEAGMARRAMRGGMRGGMPAGPALLAALFLSSGTLHLARPAVFEGIVPPWLPRHRDLVYASGIAELACAVGLLHPRSRAKAGYASAALLVAMFPANVQMALDASRAGTAYRLLSYARLPLQVPLVWTALRAAGRGRPVRAVRVLRPVQAGEKGTSRR